MDNQYKIKSNRESGGGRYDIGLIPREERYPGIIMELKWKKELDEDKLAGLADEALAQIDYMGYDAEMKEDGIKDILKFGIAFSGKKVSVKTK
ncbi:MAG: PD-(D/E)XK nuclease domain-containing protein [Frisingicoccus sp.]